MLFGERRKERGTANLDEYELVKLRASWKVRPFFFPFSQGTNGKGAVADRDRVQDARQALQATDMRRR